MLFSTTVEMLDLIWAAYVQVSMNPYQCETDKDFFFLSQPTLGSV